MPKSESKCSLILARSTKRSTGRVNGQIFDRWPVDRPVDRKVNFDLSASQWADLFGAYLYPIPWLFWLRFLERKIPHLIKCFNTCFSKEFLCLKDQSSFVFKSVFNSKKIVFWEFVFGLKIIYLFGDFPKWFSLLKHFVFSHLSLSCYPLYRIFVLWERDWFVVFWSLSCKPSYFVLSLLCRGWFLEWWLAPSKWEVEIVFSSL